MTVPGGGTVPSTWFENHRLIRGILKRLLIIDQVMVKSSMNE